MSDLIDDPMPGSNTPEFSVGEIAGAVKKLVEGELGWVRVRGEVGRVVLARSGHLYFDLKDERNVLSCMTWKGQVPGIGVMPEEGMEVVAEGRMTASGFQSKFSLNAQHIAIAGEGALMALLEKRKKALAAEGLFDDSRKSPIPYLPDIIGVVTSPQGAVIRDILHRLRDRFPRKVLIWPVAVQGDRCAPDVARAIEGFNAMTPGGALPRPDLLIVARGGGSVEDLWGFNEEIVVRAVAGSAIPLISAVGHETDTTLIDLAADRRAPTPTAAAEMAVPVRLDLMAWLDQQDGRLTGALTGGIKMRRQRVSDLSRALPRAEALLDSPRQRLDTWSEKLPRALTGGVERRRVEMSKVSGAIRPSVLRGKVDLKRGALNGAAKRLQLDVLKRDVARNSEKLDNLLARLSKTASRQVERWNDRLSGLERLRQTVGYEATLQRGYAVVRGDGDVVTTRSAAEKASALEVQFADGRLEIGGAGKAKSPAKAKKKSPEQGSLF
ncbi:MAG: exodeoxyribonuclease VII large subunit [Pseudomonadota bacterium]